MGDFLIDQYERDSKLAIQHNYLTLQFGDSQEILNDIGELLRTGDFTLGKVVREFERSFAKLVHTPYAVGVGSGTDALRLSLLALDLPEGAAVATTPFTFVATVGAIATAGLTPLFVDIADDLNLDPCKLNSVRSEVQACVPVHWAGRPIDISEICRQLPEIPIVEDACHAVLATNRGKYAGSQGTMGCFSFHPLKNLNVWGDGGIITTSSEELAERLRLLRNHGLSGRDQCEEFALNSRLDSIQAIVGLHMLGKLEDITERRRRNAALLDQALAGVDGVRLLPRRENEYEVFHLYQAICEDRNGLRSYLVEQHIDAKIHYPIPLHLQPAARKLGYQRGDFPVAESVCDSVLSLPVHEFIEERHIDYMAAKIRAFYDVR